MNERIKELAEQADNYAEQTVHYYNGQFEGLTWEGKLKQARDTKFAELIVQECAQVCRNQPNIYALKADRDNCAIGIEEHFGVSDE